MTIQPLRQREGGSKLSMIFLTSKDEIGSIIAYANFCQKRTYSSRGGNLTPNPVANVCSAKDKGGAWQTGGSHRSRTGAILSLPRFVKKDTAGAVP